MKILLIAAALGSVVLAEPAVASAITDTYLPHTSIYGPNLSIVGLAASISQGVSAETGGSISLERTFEIYTDGSGPAQGYLQIRTYYDTDFGGNGRAGSSVTTADGRRLVDNMILPATLGTGFILQIKNTAFAPDAAPTSWSASSAHVWVEAYSQNGAQVAVLATPEPGTFWVSSFGALLLLLTYRSVKNQRRLIRISRNSVHLPGA